jgi:hypothetical protein
MPRRFLLTVDAEGRGSLVDKDTGHEIEDVVSVTVVSRANTATRVIVGFLGEVAADIEAHDIERANPPPPRGDTGGITPPRKPPPPPKDW